GPQRGAGREFKRAAVDDSGQRRAGSFDEGQAAVADDCTAQDAKYFYFRVSAVADDGGARLACDVLLAAVEHGRADGNSPAFDILETIPDDRRAERGARRPHQLLPGIGRSDGGAAGKDPLKAEGCDYGAAGLAAYILRAADGRSGCGAENFL